MYHERLGYEGPKNNLIRIRWYGSHVNPPSEVWMERKRRNNEGKNPTFDSVKERFLLKNKYVEQYMQGTFTTAAHFRQKAQKVPLSNA